MKSQIAFQHQFPSFPRPSIIASVVARIKTLWRKLREPKARALPATGLIFDQCQMSFPWGAQ
jgi:hypothetical protein